MKINHNDALCSGCRVCELVCALQHYQENNPKKSAIRISGQFPVPGRFEIKVCNQCGACMAVCPTGAITVADGVYRIDRETCIGCQACVAACGQKLIFVHRDETAPIKCDLCGECIRYCPRRAVTADEGKA